MNVNGISSLTSQVSSNNSQGKKNSANAKSAAFESDLEVIYEKSNPESTYKTENAALIEQLKADSEQRVSQFRDLVTNMMTQQGVSIGEADDIWKYLASGELTIDEAAKQKAQEAISKDGYWGVEQTSDRIVEFAKALSGNNPQKADLLTDAFIQGFNEATKTWGKELPDISKDTYDAVLEKMEKWKNGEE